MQTIEALETNRSNTGGVAFLAIPSVTLLAGKEDNWEIEKEMIDRYR